MKKMKNKTVTLSLVCIAVIAIVIGRYCLVHQVDTTGLRKGMAKSEVQELLGEPTAILKEGTVWLYDDKALVWCDVWIYFDEEGRHTSIFHNH